MTGRDVPGFVDFLVDRAGEYLRSVVVYDADSSEVVFLREEGGEELPLAKVDAIVEHCRQENSEMTKLANRRGRGPLDCTVRCFGSAVEFHFARSDETGTVVELDPAAAQALYGFVRDCLDAQQDT